MAAERRRVTPLPDGYFISPLRDFLYRRSRFVADVQFKLIRIEIEAEETWLPGNLFARNQRPLESFAGIAKPARSAEP